MNRHNLGGFFVGFAFALIAMSTITVFADNLSQIEVSLGKVKLMVHGNSVDRETILFNGTTFVPLRAVAEVLDQEVSYDSTISTAYIDTKGTNRQAQIDAMQRSNKEIEYYYGLDRIPRFDIFSGISGRTLEGSSAGDWDYIIYGHEYDSISETTINNYGKLLVAKGFIPIDFDRYNKEGNRQILGAYRRNNTVIILEKGNMVIGLDLFVKVINANQTDPFNLNSMFIRF